jgi:hypothetical protein
MDGLLNPWKHLLSCRGESGKVKPSLGKQK